MLARGHDVYVVIHDGAAVDSDIVTVGHFAHRRRDHAGLIVVQAHRCGQMTASRAC
ncbi:MAG: hypothetical protein CHACPFDD_01870 [Phycisphaerae bacterium]|nr:hypothetical protein [Phycisphaerae bacterium]